MAWPSAVSAAQEGLRRASSDGIGAMARTALRRDVADALAETLQLVERALADFGRQAALAVEAFGEADHVAQAIDHAQAPSTCRPTTM
jgi:hypothetical protein